MRRSVLLLAFLLISAAGFAQTQADSLVQDIPLIHWETMPEFQGGDLSTFRDWVATQIRYPQDALEQKIEGKVPIKFVVEKDGSVSNVEPIFEKDSTKMKLPQSMIDEAVRVIVSSPQWAPGTFRNEPVRIFYVVPVEFSIPVIVAEKMPTFKGRDFMSLYGWISGQFRYPEALGQAVGGDIVVHFIIEKSGVLSNIEITKSPHEALSEEMIRILKNSPRWEPGEHHGKPVRVSLIIPFHIDPQN